MSGILSETLTLCIVPVCASASVFSTVCLESQDRCSYTWYLSVSSEVWKPEHSLSQGSASGTLYSLFSGSCSNSKLPVVPHTDQLQDDPAGHKQMSKVPSLRTAQAERPRVTFRVPGGICPVTRVHEGKKNLTWCPCQLFMGCIVPGQMQ